MGDWGGFLISDELHFGNSSSRRNGGRFVADSFMVVLAGYGGAVVPDIALSSEPSWIESPLGKLISFVHW